MENNTIRITSLAAGQVIQAGYRKWYSPCQFIGFGTDTNFKSVPYATLKEIRSHVADKEAHYAVFHDIEGDYTWAAYYWQGRWRVGTSADTLKLAAV